MMDVIQVERESSDPSIPCSVSDHLEALSIAHFFGQNCHILFLHWMYLTQNCSIMKTMKIWEAVLKLGKKSTNHSGKDIKRVPDGTGLRREYTLCPPNQGWMNSKIDDGTSSSS